MNTIKRVKEHYDECVKRMLDEKYVFGVFLIGSQNYGLATSNSDIDTKAIVFPTLYDLSTNQKPMSKEVHLDNEEHIIMTDFRLWMEQLRKGNPNVIETLFTEYFVINPMYQEVWEQLILIREEIARIDIKATCHASKGLYLNKQKYCFRETADTQELFAEFGYNPKALMGMLRAAMFLTKYISKENFPMTEVLRVDEYRDYLLEVKSGKKYCLEEAKVLSEHYEKIVNQMVENQEKYLETFSEVEDYYTKWHKIDKVSEAAFKTLLRSELNE